MKTLDTELTFSNTAMTADRTSNTIEVQGIIHYSVQFVFTGTPTGSIILQKSNDGTNWVAMEPDLDPAGDTALSGAMIEITNAGHKFMRAFYDFSSGTGTLGTCRVFGKGT